ncbi:MAG: Flp pilus assembly complex ATPase component TadA, partial [Geobacteraceae bacterium]|nr:Flp pilus assembly complex ATPase component TadA [Geobacteraceae bacterium]
MQKQGAEALTIKSAAVVEMTVAGQSRPVSSKPTEAEQIHTLLAEIIPDYRNRLQDGRGNFPYPSPFGSFQLFITAGGNSVDLTIRTAPSAPAPEATEPPAPNSENSVSSLISHLDELFHQMLDMKASDLHLKSGKAPMIRIDGSMTFMAGREPIGPDALDELLHMIMPEKNRAEFKETNDTDFAYELGERSRMRANVFRDIAGIGAVFRQIPTKILTAQQLGLPDVVLSFCDFDKGLVVVTGPTGSGKSTTLAAMIDYINDKRDAHLITIEDPVEFVHKDKKCHINQREVGIHTKGFKHALRAALREDPDIVLVGEMRDLETV